MTAWVPGSATSSTGAQSTVTPTSCEVVGDQAADQPRRGLGELRVDAAPIRPAAG